MRVAVYRGTIPFIWNPLDPVGWLRPWSVCDNYVKLLAQLLLYLGREDLHMSDRPIS